MIGTNTIGEDSSVQGIVQIVYKPKDDEFLLTHEQLFGTTQAKRRVLTKGMNPPGTFQTYWDTMIYLFVETMGCDLDLWKGGVVKKVVFPVASAKGDMVSIQANNGESQTAMAKEKFMRFSENHKEVLETLERAAIDWIVELEVKAKKELANMPIQQNLVDLPGGRKGGNNAG